MKAPRPGSRKAQVFDALQQHGPDAAVKLGLELDLADGTVRSWLGAWGKALNIDATVTGAIPRTTKARVAPAVKGKDWGAEWTRKGAKIIFAENQMWWAEAPHDVAVGDCYTWARRRLLVIDGRSATVPLLLRQIGEVEFTPKPRVERVKAKRA